MEPATTRRPVVAARARSKGVGIGGSVREKVYADAAHGLCPSAVVGDAVRAAQNSHS
ncbi:hypothetical protein ACWD9K_32380 [Streptomyces sp. 900116325]